jgi:catechol 2,3-dioxygenase-like lactoylglutathione lyase family enzyme
MSDAARTAISEVRTVAVPVTDQDRALECYAGKLGFEKRLDLPFGGGQRWIEVAPPGASTTIALAPAPEGTPTGVDTGIRFTTEDADADHAALVARGVDADPEVLRLDGGVPPMFSFRDPDGNTLYVVERARERG